MKQVMKIPPRSTRRASSAVRLAIIGTGGMANHHAKMFTQVKGCRMVAACDIDAARARTFAETHGIHHSFDDCAKMLQEVEIDAVSVVTPDAAHMPVTLQCLRAGKHVLCEKPLALNARDAAKMTTAARKAGVVNMVNFSYREWPCIQSAALAVRRGDIGEVRHVEASYLQAWLASKVWGDWRENPTWLWRLSSRHGSKGALGDVGVHIIDYATFPVGPVSELYCRLKTFDKAPGGRIGDYRFDVNDSATLNVEFANGALGVIHTTRWAPGHSNRLALKICGTHGTIDMDSERATDRYRICRGRDLDRSAWKEVHCKPVPNNYTRFITAIRGGHAAEPDFARGMEIQRVLDAAFASDAAHAPVRVRR